MSRGDGRVFKRRNRWWIAYYGPEDGRNSVEFRESAGETEEQARKLLDKRRREVKNHNEGLKAFISPKHQRMRVDELLQQVEQDWEIHERKSLPQMRSHLKKIKEFFGDYRATAVTSDLLRLYMASRQKDGAKPGTINKELAGLKRAFSLAVQGEKLARAPQYPEKLKENNARKGFFERADFDAVLAHIGDSDVRDFLEFFYWTGMRPGEIRSLCWAAFDRGSWTLRLHASDAKIGKGRAIAAEGPLQQIIRRRLSARRFGCDFIFHQDGKPLRQFYKMWKAACEKAGVIGRIPYDLRRTAVRNLIRAGVSENIAMAISGHKTRAIFDRYDIVDERDLKEAVLKVAAYVEHQPQQDAAEVIAIPEVSGK